MRSRYQGYIWEAKTRCNVNFSKQCIIDFTKISKQTMCRASKSTTSCISKLKFILSFRFPNTIPDDVTASTIRSSRILKFHLHIILGNILQTHSTFLLSNRNTLCTARKYSRRTLLNQPLLLCGLVPDLHLKKRLFPAKCILQIRIRMSNSIFQH